MEEELDVDRGTRSNVITATTHDRVKYFNFVMYKLSDK